jgi:hypothetical protein
VPSDDASVAAGGSFVGPEAGDTDGEPEEVWGAGGFETDGVVERLGRAGLFAGFFAGLWTTGLMTTRCGASFLLPFFGFAL